MAFELQIAGIDGSLKIAFFRLPYALAPQNRDLTLFDVRSRRGMIEWPFAIAGPSEPEYRRVRRSFLHILADMLTLFESSGGRLYPPILLLTFFAYSELPTTLY